MEQHIDDGAHDPRTSGPDTSSAGALGQDPSAPGSVDLGELWLLAALDPQRFVAELGAARAAAFCADPRNAAEIAALRGFLGEARAGLAHERHVAHSRTVRRVTRRVLARTTREQRGWRGDVQLVGDFVADRLRASAWLRVAAAALFVQVTVVPILAWHMLRDSNAGIFQLRIERRAPAPEFTRDNAELGADPAHAIESPALDPTLPVLPVSEVAPELTALGERICAEYGRARVPALSAREVLAAGPGTAALDASATEWALAHRALVLASGGGTALLAGPSERGAAAFGVAGQRPPAGPSDVTRLLQLEQALDRRALLGHAAELSALLDELGATLTAGPVGSLAAAVQRRAVALHVVAHTLPADGAEQPVAALIPGAAYGQALVAALTAEGADAAGPWARAWLAALAVPR